MHLMSIMSISKNNLQGPPAFKVIIFHPMGHKGRNDVTLILQSRDMYYLGILISDDLVKCEKR